MTLPVRTLLGLAALLACSSAGGNARTPAPPQSSMTADQPPGVGELVRPQMTSATQPIAVAGGPMTAADAARAAAQDSSTRAEAGQGSTGEGTDPCSVDADCGLTSVGPGACCALLCAPRAVAREKAKQLEAGSRQCAGGCPIPSCAQPPWRFSAACVKGRCTRKAEPNSGPTER